VEEVQLRFVEQLFSEGVREDIAGQTGKAEGAGTLGKVESKTTYRAVYTCPNLIERC
jgi:hypothetical protein